jgi:hypothetical protein
MPELVFPRKVMRLQMVDPGLNAGNARKALLTRGYTLRRRLKGNPTLQGTRHTYSFTDLASRLL